MDKVFEVALSNADNGAYTTLALPAEPYAVLDAWERLRPAPGTAILWEVEDYGGVHLPVSHPPVRRGFPGAQRPGGAAGRTE